MGVRKCHSAGLDAWHGVCNWESDMKIHFGGTGWGWRLWGISNKDHWFIGLSIRDSAPWKTE
jgi:hypothetical protein